jgi:hypothetical protein
MLREALDDEATSMASGDDDATIILNSARPRETLVLILDDAVGSEGAVKSAVRAKRSRSGLPGNPPQAARTILPAGPSAMSEMP